MRRSMNRSAILLGLGLGLGLGLLAAQPARAARHFLDLPLEQRPEITVRNLPSLIRGVEAGLAASEGSPELLVELQKQLDELRTLQTYVQEIAEAEAQIVVLEREIEDLEARGATAVNLLAILEEEIEIEDARDPTVLADLETAIAEAGEGYARAVKNVADLHLEFDNVAHQIQTYSDQLATNDPLKTQAALDEARGQLQAALREFDAAQAAGEKVRVARERAFALRISVARYEEQRPWMKERVERLIPAQLRLAHAELAAIKPMLEAAEHEIELEKEWKARLSEEAMHRMYKNERELSETLAEMAEDDHRRPLTEAQLRWFELGRLLADVRAETERWGQLTAGKPYFYDDADSKRMAADIEKTLENEHVGLLPTGRVRLGRAVSESRDRLKRSLEGLADLGDLRQRHRQNAEILAEEIEGLPQSLQEGREKAVELRGDALPDEFTSVGWDGVQRELTTVLAELETAFADARTKREAAYVMLREIDERETANLVELEHRLLWTREASAISLRAVPQGLRDVGDLPGYVYRQALATLGGWRSYLSQDPHLRRMGTTAAGALLLLAGSWWLGRRLARPAIAPEAGRQRGGVAGAAARKLGTALPELGIALAFVGVAVAAGADPWQLSLWSILAFTPLIYRAVRVLLDLLLLPVGGKARGLLGLDQKTGERLNRLGFSLATVSLGFVPIGLLMRLGGYHDRNPGLVELWWLGYQVLMFLAVLLALRPGHLLDRILGQGARSALARLYPPVAGLAVAGLILYSLRFETAVRFFLFRILATAVLGATAVWAYRSLARRFFPDCDPTATLAPRNFESEDAFLAAGRDEAAEGALRSALLIAIAIPALVALAAVWHDVAYWFDDGLGALVRNIVGAAFAVWITFAALRRFRRFVQFVILPSTELDKGMQYAIANLSSYTVVAAGLVVALFILRVDPANIALFTSALMVGVGFGLQDIVRNFISGVILLVEQPVRVGDCISIDNHVGIIERIDLRSTRVRTLDNVGIAVPNAKMIGQSLTNLSAGAVVRHDLMVTVADASDLERLTALCLEVLESNEHVLDKPRPTVLLAGFSESSLDLKVRFWIAKESSSAQLGSDLLQQLSDACRESDPAILVSGKEIGMHEIVRDWSRRAIRAGEPAAGGAAAAPAEQ